MYTSYSTGLVEMNNLTLSSLYTIPPSTLQVISGPEKAQESPKEKPRQTKKRQSLKSQSGEMVPGFSRSISLTLSPSHSGKNGRAASCHKRSASLPCRSHPIISHLEEQIRAIQSWSANPNSRHSEEKIAKLASCLKNVSKCQLLGLNSDALEAEITWILVEAISATVVASMDVFSRVAAMSASTSLTKTSNTMRPFRALALNSLSNSMVPDEEFGVAEKLEEWDVSIRNVESCSERVFRKLISLRISLLNISTPSL